MLGFHTIRFYAGRYRETARRKRTERLIARLPLDVRKDIGWPDYLRHGSGNEAVAQSPSCC